MNRPIYITLCVLEVAAILALVGLMALPIQDYALREYFEWQAHPSPQTYQAFLEKQRQERAIRLGMATPVVVLALFVGGTLSKYRGKKR